VGTKRNFWKKAVAQEGTRVKDAEAQIRENCFRDFPLVKVARTVVPAQPVRVGFLEKAALCKSQ
jgi:hypothetical protein